MGSIFSTPKPPAIPTPPPLPDPDAQDRERRLEALERRRRGRIGLIATSSRGLLSPKSGAASGKTLLGE
jgi:hypothetical protein